MHRSWTGNGFVEAIFGSVDDGGWRVAQALVERDQDRYRGKDDEYDCLMLELVLSAIVLGQPAQELRSKLVELTRKAAGAADVPAGIVQHSALGCVRDRSFRPPIRWDRVVKASWSAVATEE
ncbi:hypothetical protein [Streptomyces aureus]|uniref:hypothetical protein n=1 Tax=Streptomyces aureus TaxID=193461 RepID=UPI0031DCC85D